MIITVGLLIIASFIYIKYKPLYKVTLNGKVIGYVTDKRKMQEKIEEFENNLEGNITSIKVEAMPEYELELVSGIKEGDTVENEVLAMVEENAEIKCRTYAIKLDGNEKAIVNSQEEAESVVNDIRTATTEAVELNLEIEEQEKDIKEVNPDTTTTEVAKTEINKDVEVTSPYGKRSSGFHTGTDFAIAQGTPVYAAASGTVIFSGRKGSYGNLVIIDHGNGYQTYYAHCYALYVSAGQTVSQGQNISAVGTTGNSTGPHLHFEIRYNGSTLNPLGYV